jgi:predicted transcriptional regulator
MEMVCDILGVLSQGPTKPTQILYKANMSWKVLSSHLEYLHTQGLVEKVGQGGRRVEYTLTQRGRFILQMYEKLKASLYGAVEIYPSLEVFPLIERTPSIPRNGGTTLW